jgi:hypothetical protein
MQFIKWQIRAFEIAKSYDLDLIKSKIFLSTVSVVWSEVFAPPSVEGPTRAAPGG